MWVKRLMGFLEQNPEQVRSKLRLEGSTLTSLVNGRQLECGTLTIPSLGELRAQVAALHQNKNNIQDSSSSSSSSVKRLKLSQIVHNVQTLHKDRSNAGAFFQVASQFNLLEMASPHAIPEDGVGIYGSDHTQGPACAIACGGGTLYRNYYVNVDSGEGDQQMGQTRDFQIDCLADLGVKLGNKNQNGAALLWEMKNGYALATKEGLERIRSLLQTASEEERDNLRSLLRIGIQSNVGVTFDGCTHAVTQAYCSALPVAYGDHEPEKWQDFARLILEASYEATFCAAILNAAKTGNNKVYLTLVGGGVFGNRLDWILDGIERSIECHRDSALDVAFVSYRSPNEKVQQLVDRFNSQS